MKDLRAMAERYVDTLVPGDRIIEDVDGPFIAEFRHLLPAALAARGLRAEPTPGGFLVVAVVRPPAKRPGGPIYYRCRRCRGVWLHCSCGVGEAITIQWGGAGA